MSIHRVGGILLSHTSIFGFQACVGRKHMPFSSNVFFFYIFKLEVLTAGMDNQ